MSTHIDPQLQMVHARLSGRNLLAFVLETIGIALLLCAPIAWVMPMILPFDSLPVVLCFGTAGLFLVVLGVFIRPSILRPDFVNSIMLYQEEQS